jgi:FMN phosphatase YigB (HAD superfamily)
MKQRPKAVVFDLGKVLLDFDYQRAARNMLPFCAITEKELTAAMNQSELLFRYETGLISTSEFFEEVRTVSKFCHELERFEPLFGDIFSPILEMISLNDRLQTAGIPTYIFSNTNEMAIRHIREKYPFFENFSGYVFSFEHRSMKPDAKVYEVVERTAGLRGANLLYIDDRAENVAAGAERGWQTIHHTSSAETIAKVERLLF